MELFITLIVIAIILKLLIGQVKKYLESKKQKIYANYDDISKHNKENITPNKYQSENIDFNEKLRRKEEEYKNRYQKEKDIKENSDNDKKDEYFSELKKENEQKRNSIREFKKAKEKRKKSNYFTKLKEKERKKEYQEKKKKGDEYEILVGKHYEEKDYVVIYHGLDKGKEDGGIDLICKKGNETVLVQCKNWKRSKYQIRHTHVKAFYTDCLKYMKENNINEESVKLKYAVPDKKVIHSSAIKIFRDKFYNCRYEII